MRASPARFQCTSWRSAVSCVPSRLTWVGVVGAVIAQRTKVAHHVLHLTQIDDLWTRG